MMNWSTFATLGLLTATLHWVFARSKIAEPFWKLGWLPEGRVREFLDGLLSCPACSGFWLGLGLGAVGVRPMVTGYAWLDVVCAGLAGVYTTPVCQGVMLWGLRATTLSVDLGSTGSGVQVDGSLSEHGLEAGENGRDPGA